MQEELQQTQLKTITGTQRGFWQSISHWRRRLVVIGGLLAAAIALLGNIEKAVDYARKATSFVVPSVKISPGIVGSNTNALFAEFIFRNTGSMLLRNNEISCDIVAANGKISSDMNFIYAPGRTISQFVSELATDATVTRNCGQVVPTPAGIVRMLYPATFTIRMISRWPCFWPVAKWTTTATFIGIFDSNGRITIQPDHP